MVRKGQGCVFMCNCAFSTGWLWIRCNNQCKHSYTFVMSCLLIMTLSGVCRGANDCFYYFKWCDAYFKVKKMCLMFESVYMMLETGTQVHLCIVCEWLVSFQSLGKFLVTHKLICVFSSHVQPEARKIITFPSIWIRLYHNTFLLNVCKIT